MGGSSSPSYSHSHHACARISPANILRARELGGALFDHRDHIARARDARRPGLVEIGDQALEPFATSAPRRAAPCRRTDRPRNARRHPPRSRTASISRFELVERHRQMMLRIPAVEFLPQRLAHHRVHHEKGFGRICRHGSLRQHLPVTVSRPSFSTSIRSALVSRPLA